MLSKPREWIRKKLTSCREFRKESTGIDPLLCSCGHVMEFVESFFPSGLEVKINETWKLYDWQNELDPLQVHSVRFLRSDGNQDRGRSLRLGYCERHSMFFRLLYSLRCFRKMFSRKFQKQNKPLFLSTILFSVRWSSSYFVVYNPKEHYCFFGLFLFSALNIALS